MFKKQKSLIYKISTIAFLLLLLIPCTIKADIKVSLNIATSTINKDKVVVNTCSVFSQSDTQKQVVQHNVDVKKDSVKLLGRNTVALPCSKSKVLEQKKVLEDVHYYSTPIFIHFRELII